MRRFQRCLERLDLQLHPSSRLSVLDMRRCDVPTTPQSIRLTGYTVLRDFQCSVIPSAYSKDLHVLEEWGVA